MPNMALVGDSEGQPNANFRQIALFGRFLPQNADIIDRAEIWNTFIFVCPFLLSPPLPRNLFPPLLPLASYTSFVFISSLSSHLQSPPLRFLFPSPLFPLLSPALVSCSFPLILVYTSLHFLSTLLLSPLILSVWHFLPFPTPFLLPLPFFPSHSIPSDRQRGRVGTVSQSSKFCQNSGILAVSPTTRPIPLSFSFFFHTLPPFPFPFYSQWELGQLWHTAG